MRSCAPGTLSLSEREAVCVLFHGLRNLADEEEPCFSDRTEGLGERGGGQKLRLKWPLPRYHLQLPVYWANCDKDPSTQVPGESTVCCVCFAYSSLQFLLASFAFCLLLLLAAATAVAAAWVAMHPDGLHSMCGASPATFARS